MQKLKSWGLGALILAFAAVLEWKSAMGAFALNASVSAYQHAGLSIACALLAFVFGRLAGAYKTDERPFVREAATLARLVSVACIIVPTVYLGSALKADRIARDWPAYQVSPAYAADVVLASDMMADRYERDAARARTVKPSVTLDVVDGEFWIAIAFQLLFVTAAGIPLFASATAEDVRHWRKVAAGKKAAATRRANAAKRKRKTNVVPLFDGRKTA